MLLSSSNEKEIQGDCRLFSSFSVSTKVTEQIFLGAISEDKKEPLNIGTRSPFTVMAICVLNFPDCQCTSKKVDDFAFFLGGINAFGRTKAKLCSVWSHKPYLNSECTLSLLEGWEIKTKCLLQVYVKTCGSQQSWCCVSGFDTEHSCEQTCWIIRCPAVQLSRGSRSWSLWDLLAVSVGSPCPKWNGIIPSANEHKMGSMPWVDNLYHSSNTLNCTSGNPMCQRTFEV